MMKKYKWLKALSLIILSLCVAFLSVGKGYSASATEQEYEWQSVECISIAPPYTYGGNGTASFQVSFDRDITSVNYKHLAAGATALKTFSRYDTPNMTNDTIDSLDKSGVLDSLNDCIAFNGVKVREFQKHSVIAVMIQMGELGANNTMNIDFNGDVPEAKILNFQDEFVFTFYAGLKFPSGVELKETVTWKYNPETLSFSQIPNETDLKDPTFKAFYNGHELTNENNIITIYDKQAFNLDYLTVIPNSLAATVEIKPQFDELKDGDNYLLIVCRAGNKVDFVRLQIVFDLQQVEVDGCSGAIGADAGFLITIALSIGAILIKRSKRA